MKLERSKMRLMAKPRVFRVYPSEGPCTPFWPRPPFGNIRVDPVHAYRSSRGTALGLEGWLSRVL